MSLAGNIDGTGVRKVQALTMDDVCYENPNEHVRQRLLCRSVFSVLKSSFRLHSRYLDSHLRLVCSRHSCNILRIDQAHDEVPVEVLRVSISLCFRIMGRNLGEMPSVLLLRPQSGRRLGDTYHSFLATFETLRRDCLRTCRFSKTPPFFAYFWSSLSLIIPGNFWTNLTCTRHHFGFSRSDFSSK